MRKLLLFLAPGLALGLAPATSSLGLLAGSASLVVLGVLLAVAASERICASAVAFGAAAALGGSVLGAVSPALGGACLVALAYAERTARVGGTGARLAHVTAAVIGGAASGAITASYAGSSLLLRGAALVVASVLAALPFLFEADDPIAHFLDSAAADVSEPARAYLREAAAIRRESRDAVLDRSTAVRAGESWRTLLGLAETRLRLETTQLRTQRLESPSGADPYRSSMSGSARSSVDTRIAGLVTTLGGTLSLPQSDRSAG